MTQKTVTEKDQFLEAWHMEGATTLKLLKAYPAAKADFKPHAKSRTARELAWIFVVEQHVIEAAIQDKVDFSAPMPKPPAAWDEIVRAYQETVAETAAKVKKLPDEALNRMITFPTGPKQTGQVRTGQVFWMMMMDAIHHRGQFSVYLRMAGGKVPSIYGPSLDEPWH
jgi:uncharacterized damage-inducible protein DinB